MKKDENNSARAAELRRLAEQRLRERQTAKATPRSQQDTLRLLHELQVHQIELEMQNEELMQARTQVEAGLERYTDLYDFAPVGYFTLEGDGTIRQVNITGAGLLGIERSRLVRRGLGRFVVPEDRDRWDEHLAGVWQSAQKQTCELALKREDGLAFHARLESIRTDGLAEEAGGGPGPAIRVAMIDISDRKRAERITARYAMISKYARDPILLVHVDGRIMEANEASLVFYGYGSDELLSRRIQDLRRGDDPDLVRRQMEQARTAGIRFEAVHVRKDGTKVPVEVSSKSVSIDGEEMLLSVIRDITDRKRAEALLRSRLHLFELAQHGSMEEVMQAALDEAERLTGSCIGFFHFVSEDQEQLWLQAWSTNTLKNMCQAEGKGLHYPISEAGVWVDCFHARAPVIHNNYAGLSHKKGLPEGHAPIVRELAVPILRQGAVVAIIGVGNKATDYTQDDVAVLQELTLPVMDLLTTKQAEGVMNAARKRLKEIVRLAPAFMCILHGREHVFEMCNERYFQIVGRRDILDRPIRQALPELEGQGFFELLDGVYETGKPYSGKEVPVRLQRTPGGPLEEVFVDFVYMPLREADGSISGIFVHGVDVTEQVLARRQIEQLALEARRAEEQVRTINEQLEQRVAERTAEAERRARQLQALAVRLTRTEEKERRRIAGMLHDHLQQLLVGAKIGLSALSGQVKDRVVQDAIRQVDGLLGQSLEATRTLVYELVPPVLYESGLGAAIGWLGRQMQEKHGLIVHVMADERVETANEDARVFLYHAVRELLLNVLKHAKVDRAEVRCELREDGWVQVTVRDEGVGFALAAASEKEESPTGFGMFSIREHIEWLGGRVETASSPGKGTSVRLSLPLQGRKGRK